MYIEANDDDTHLHFVTKIPKEGIHKNTLDINEFIRASGAFQQMLSQIVLNFNTYFFFQNTIYKFKY